MWRKKEGIWGIGKNISCASIHPFSTSSSSPSPRVGKITTQPGLRGRGEPGGSVRKQMSPLAAASASGESCTGGPSWGHSPPTSQASRSQLLRLGGGGFFRLSVSRVQLFYLGAVLTRPRLADAKRQSLHDSNKRQREITWRVPTPPLKLQPALPLQCGTGARAPGYLSCGPRGPLCLGSWRLG